MTRNQTTLSRPRYAVGPIRRLRMAGPGVLRAPWLIAIGFLALAGVATAGIVEWPRTVPWSTFTLLAVAAGLLLTPRWLALVYVGLLASMAVLGTTLGTTKTATIGSQIVTVLTMLLMVWLANARARIGVFGIGGESMLVDMRDRLRAQGELPELPESWSAEVALESAYGEGFAGDFVVASRSTDGRMLEIALVDVSGKGRNAGTRSLLLSGAMGGLLGEMSEQGFLSSANNHLQRLRWPEGFATAVHVAVDLETGEFTIGYAGHPAAVQFSAGSGQWRMLTGGRGRCSGSSTGPSTPASTAPCAAVTRSCSTATGSSRRRTRPSSTGSTGCSAAPRPPSRRVSAGSPSGSATTRPPATATTGRSSRSGAPDGRGRRPSWSPPPRADVVSGCRRPGRRGRRVRP